MKSILLIDSFDSFTYNLVDYFGRWGVDCEVVTNKVHPSELPWQRHGAVVLSPGPETPSKAGYLMDGLRLLAGKCPILGVCLGHQAIGEMYGYALAKAQRPMHGKLASIVCQPDPIFEGIPNPMQVVRYHSLLLKENAQSPLKAIAHTSSGEIMAIKHQHLPIYGVQFHPEAILTTHGLQLLGNWLYLNQLIPNRRAPLQCL